MDVKKIDNKVAYRLTQLFVAIAGVVFLFMVDRAYRTVVARESEHQLSVAASSMQHHLSVELNNLILVAADLRAFLLTQPDPPDSHSFADFAATLRSHYSALDALVYVGPDRIVREIYPRAGNEHAIGLDLSKRPTAPYIEKAIRERQLIVDPPHSMSDGRFAVIARLPVFRGEKFVGLAQAILNVQSVVQYELGDLANLFTIQLRDQNGRLFWGAERLEGSAQNREVVVGNETWILSVTSARAPKIAGSVLILIWGVGSLVLLFIMRGVRNDYRLRLALKGEVADATQALRRRNEELEQQMRHRREAEDKVRKSEQSLREAQRIAHLGSWEWNLADNRLYWSDEYFRILGLQPQEIAPNFEAFLARVHPDDREVVRQEALEALKHTASYEPEHRILLPDGEIRYVRASGLFECDGEGHAQRIVGTVQDITDQKLALKALEASERKYRAVLEHASDGIIIASAEGEVLDVNRRIQTLLGYSRDELLKMHVRELHPAEEAEKLRAAFAIVRERGFSLFEHLALCKNGSTIPVEVAGSLITFADQQFALGVFRDIRERKRIEAELHEYRNHLEQLVEQRTAELTALNGELEAFSYSVSHDLRAPLRAISGFSVALEEEYGGQLNTTAHDYLRRIKSATERMGHLIDGLLQLSATVRAEMHRERVSLSTVAGELLQELNATEPTRRVRVVIGDEITALGDSALLRALMQNLLSNAWKFTRGRAAAQIEFGVTRHSGETLYFVRDNGIGFEMRYADELFKPFHRQHGSTAYEGNGIGLATVQRIVHRHGGRIWAESQPGQGATFYFTLGAEHPR